MEIPIRSLRSLITEMLLLEKAISREDWKDHLVVFLLGAIREFYKSRLGKKNNLSAQQDIDHWRREVRDLLNAASNVFNQRTKSSFNREKAYKKACEDVKYVDATKRREAEHIIMKDYDVASLDKHITKQDTLDFWSLADDALLMQRNTK